MEQLLPKPSLSKIVYSNVLQQQIRIQQPVKDKIGAPLPRAAASRRMSQPTVLGVQDCLVVNILVIERLWVQVRDSVLEECRDP